MQWCIEHFNIVGLIRQQDLLTRVGLHRHLGNMTTCWQVIRQLDLLTRMGLHGHLGNTTTCCPVNRQGDARRPAQRPCKLLLLFLQNPHLIHSNAINVMNWCRTFSHYRSSLNQCESSRSSRGHDHLLPSHRETVSLKTSSAPLLSTSAEPSSYS